jgi:hypothetical protein
MDTEEDITLALTNLIKGITMHNFKEQMRWHKVLYQIGKPALPKICSKVMSFNSPGLSQHLKLLYISGLMKLIHDIDEQEAQKVTQQLLLQGCDKVIANRLKSINAFTLNQYTRYKIKGISIFEAHGLISPHPVRSVLEKWFQRVPEQDVKKIDRLYVVPYRMQDYSGSYTPIYYIIELVWYKIHLSRPNLFSRMLLLYQEHTFYHEIGHHVYHHTFGQDPDQEREANQYAAKIMATSYPIGNIFIRIIVKLTPNRFKQYLSQHCNNS